MAAVTPVAGEVLAPEARESLRTLARVPAIADMYLAGSAALALYLDHRPVRQLDFMAAGNRLLPPDRRDLLEALLARDTGTSVETARDGLLHVRTGNDTVVRFYYYPYPLIDPEEEALGLPVASLLDLGLMKLGAIISRGTRRDFVDLHLLTQVLPLATLLERSHEKFGHVRDFPLQALKGLADFSLTEGEPMPRLNTALDWHEVRERLETEVAHLAGGEFGLPGGRPVETAPDGGERS